jgi:hypothetical protein
MRFRTTALSLCLVVIASLVATASPAAALTSTPDATPWMANGYIKASVQYGNVLFVGGSFQRLGTSVAPGPNLSPFVDGYTGLAAIDMSTGQAIPAFKPQLQASGGQTLDVYALEMVGNRLYVGGQFSMVNGEAHYNLAAIDINPVTIRDTVVSSFNPTVGIPGNANEHKFSVRTLLAGDDGLYVGGSFSKVNGKGRPKTAKVDLSTGALITGYKTAGVDGIVHDMAFSADEQSIFLAGGFKQLGTGNPRFALGRVNAATGATHPWTVPPSQIPGATSSGQICYEIAVTAARIYAGCGKTPNFVGAFRVDTGDVGTRTWQYSTGGNVQSVNLMPDGQDLVIGGHFGINSSSRYNGRMRCGPSTQGTWIRGIAIVRNVASTTSMVSPLTDGQSSASQPWVDCSWLPNLDGLNQPWPQQTQNFAGTNRYGGIWEIQVTGSHLWGLGEFRYVNAQVRRGIARFSLTGDPTPPPDPTPPVLAELVTPSPLAVQPNRQVSFTLRCPAGSDPCNGTVRLTAATIKQPGPDAITLDPGQQANYVVTLNDAAWNKLLAKANGQIGGKLTLTADGSPGTTPLTTEIAVKLKLA